MAKLKFYEKSRALYLYQCTCPSRTYPAIPYCTNFPLRQNALKKRIKCIEEFYHDYIPKTYSQLAFPSVHIRSKWSCSIKK